MVLLRWFYIYIYNILRRDKLIIIFNNFYIFFKILQVNLTQSSPLRLGHWIEILNSISKWIQLNPTSMECVNSLLRFSASTKPEYGQFPKHNQNSGSLFLWPPLPLFKISLLLPISPLIYCFLSKSYPFFQSQFQSHFFN